jgi:hypothetical protein
MRATSRSIGEDEQAGTTGSDDQTGVGTFMITGTSCPHPLYRITGVSPHQHAATDDFAEALTVGPTRGTGSG